MNFIFQLLWQHGYIVLFLALFLELIAFPLPGEVLMTYCGYLVFQNKLQWIPSIIVAVAGASSGITVSFFLGKILGESFFSKYGQYIHLDKEKMDKISIWFEKYGHKIIIIAYFIPGVRHMMGYFSGITRYKFRDFAIRAYLGAIIWSVFFISLGSIIGPKWKEYHRIASEYSMIIGCIIGIILLIIYLCNKRRRKA